MGTRGTLVSVAIACQPGCMGRGRQKHREAAILHVIAGADTPVARVVTATADIATAFDLEPASLAPKMDGSSFRRTRASEGTPASRTAPTSSSRTIRPPVAEPWAQKRTQLAELKRLSEISKSLVKLHREETALIAERDGLISRLRRQDVPWSSLAMRTGLSRQALSKRTI
ncbi:hypothetical protein MIC448_1140032 [Microbacterium sp. C448]|nr:hypothetical protein MIC448_1140032 [Microbacterium sp. C448]